MPNVTNDQRRELHARIHGKWNTGTHFFRIKQALAVTHTFDFLSDRAADSIVWALAEEMDAMYSSEEWYPIMGNMWHRIDNHPLAGVFVKSWRRKVVDLVIEYYNALAETMTDEHAS